jgi:3-oxoacyl-[acyl-carrier protein] reductase
MRNVLVSGGSRGIGLAIVQRLAAAGYGVVAVARGESEELSGAIKAAEAGQGAIHFLPCDLGEIDKIADFVKSVREKFGPLYGLVNNAGISFEGLLANTHNSQIEEIVRVNVASPIVLTKFVVRHMMADGGGRVVNIGSIIGSTGYNGLSVYGATKAAANGFSRSLAREVGRAGITVNTVAPGFIATELTKSLDAEQKGRIASRSALRRLPGVEDVASMVEYLLSDGAKNITGTVMTVDAGNTA